MYQSCQIFFKLSYKTIFFLFLYQNVDQSSPEVGDLPCAFVGIENGCDCRRAELKIHILQLIGVTPDLKLENKQRSYLITQIFILLG